MEKNRFQEEELHQKLQMKREGVYFVEMILFNYANAFCLVIAGASEAKV